MDWIPYLPAALFLLTLGGWAWKVKRQDAGLLKQALLHPDIRVVSRHPPTLALVEGEELISLRATTSRGLTPMRLWQLRGTSMHGCLQTAVCMVPEPGLPRTGADHPSALLVPSELMEPTRSLRVNAVSPRHARAILHHPPVATALGDLLALVKRRVERLEWNDNGLYLDVSCQDFPMNLAVTVMHQCARLTAALRQGQDVEPMALPLVAGDPAAQGPPSGNPVGIPR